MSAVARSVAVSGTLPDGGAPAPASLRAIP